MVYGVYLPHWVSWKANEQCARARGRAASYGWLTVGRVFSHLLYV